MEHNGVVKVLVAYFGEMDKAVDADTRLFAEDVIDSLGMLDMVEFIEDEFDVTLDQRLLVIENFETLGRVAKTVISAAET